MDLMPGIIQRKKRIGWDGAFRWAHGFLMDFLWVADGLLMGFLGRRTFGRNWMESFDTYSARDRVSFPLISTRGLEIG